MRSFVTLFIATLFLAVVASGLMAFFLPFDQAVTRVHAVCAPLFGLIVGWHLFNNRQIFWRHLGPKGRRSQLAVAACAGGAAALVLANVFPVSTWMSLSYENREREQIFRPPAAAVGRQIDGAIDVAYGVAATSFRLGVDLRDDIDPVVVVWAESEDGLMLDTLFLSESASYQEEVELAAGSRSRSDLLPVWWQRWQKRRAADRERAEVDGLSGASDRGDGGFEATLRSPSSRFYLMLEIHAADGGSQVYSALVDAAGLRRHYVMDFLALGLPDGKLGYDTESLRPGDLLIDRALLSIDFNPPASP